MTGSALPIATRLSIIWMFARAELKRRYVGTFIGLTWLIGYPIIYVAVYILVFDRMIHVKFDGASYGIFLASGLIPWIAFQEAVTASPRIFFEYIQIVKKSAFPSHLLPLSRVVASSLVFALTLAVLVVASRHYSPALAGLIPLVAAQIVFIGGLSLVLAYANVFIRDIEHLIGILILGVMFLTPVLYSPTIFPAWLRGIADFNPFALFISAYREIVVFSRWPSIPIWTGIAISTAVSLFCGLTITRWLSPKVSDHV